MFERLEILVGDKIEQLHQTTVLVIGLGGVGSYAVESLVRSGIGHIILADHDIIDITNLNRQLAALHTTIGKPKTQVWKDRIFDINPKCEVTIIQEFITKENIEQFNQYSIDYIVDACDTIETKKEIIKYALSHNIKLISSMGTAQKLDPSKLQITTLDKTSYDPLAKRLRKWMHDEGIKDKITVISSTETPLPRTTNSLGSTAFVPSVAGLLCTSYIVQDIIGGEI